MDEDAVKTKAITIGEHCANPYTTDSLINISGMSYGALSKPAVRALSHGAYQAGCWMNTGEGGADLVVQIGTAKYGVCDKAGGLDVDKVKEIAAHPQIKMFELKLSQGAKPGKGGILPAEKVTKEIAKIRGIAAYEASISPNRHPEINSVDDILDMLHKIRQAADKPVGIKMVLGATSWLDSLMKTINKRGQVCAPDFITLDSADGGTGAAPMSLMDDMGVTLTRKLTQTHR